MSIYKTIKSQVAKESKKTSKVQGDLFSDINNHGDLFSDLQALSPQEVELIGLRAKNKLLMEQNKKQAEHIAVAQVEIPKMAEQLTVALATNQKLCSRVKSASILVRVLDNSNRTLKGWCTKYRTQIANDREAEDYARHLTEQEAERQNSIPFPEIGMTGLTGMAASGGECNADKLEKAIRQQKRELLKTNSN